MAWTTAEEERIQRLETRVNELQTALNNLATRAQLTALLNIRQAEIISLQEDLALLTQRVTNLE